MIVPFESLSSKFYMTRGRKDDLARPRGLFPGRLEQTGSKSFVGFEERSLTSGGRSGQTPFVASKGFRAYISGLESILAGISISFDSKWLSMNSELQEGPSSLRKERASGWAGN